jgi:hypothetical protein
MILANASNSRQNRHRANAGCTYFALACKPNDRIKAMQRENLNESVTTAAGT